MCGFLATRLCGFARARTPGRGCALAPSLAGSARESPSAHPSAYARARLRLPPCCQRKTNTKNTKSRAATNPKTNGPQVCWGDHFFGQLTTPTNPFFAKAISASDFTSCAIKPDGYGVRCCF